MGRYIQGGGGRQAGEKIEKMGRPGWEKRGVQSEVLQPSRGEACRFTWFQKRNFCRLTYRSERHDVEPGAFNGKLDGLLVQLEVMSNSDQCTLNFQADSGFS